MRSLLDSALDWGAALADVKGQIRAVQRRGVRTLPNYWRVRRLRRQAVRVNNLPGVDRVECPCCGWTGGEFLPVFLGARYRANASCPRCQSRERHRAYFLYYQKVERLANCNGRVLYVGPARCITEPLFRSHNLLSLVTSDIRDVGVTIQADLTCFPAESESFDRILCHHILEHIPDDGAAIAEIWRLLSSGGVAYISVPQNFALETTEEWGKPNPQVSNHVRDYGRDFAVRLKRFDVDVVDVSVLWGTKVQERYCLGPRELVYRCVKRCATYTDEHLRDALQEQASGRT